MAHTLAMKDHICRKAWKVKWSHTKFQALPFGSKDIFQNLCSHVLSPQGEFLTHLFTTIAFIRYFSLPNPFFLSFRIHFTLTLYLRLKGKWIGFISAIVLYWVPNKIRLDKTSKATRACLTMFRRGRSSWKEQAYCLGKMVNVNRCQEEGKAIQLLLFFFIKEMKHLHIGKSRANVKWVINFTTHSLQWN